MVNEAVRKLVHRIDLAQQTEDVGEIVGMLNAHFSDVNKLQATFIGEILTFEFREVEGVDGYFDFAQDEWSWVRDDGEVADGAIYQAASRVIITDDPLSGEVRRENMRMFNDLGAGAPVQPPSAEDWLSAYAEEPVQARSVSEIRAEEEARQRENHELDAMIESMFNDDVMEPIPADIRPFVPPSD